MFLWLLSMKITGLIQSSLYQNDIMWHFKMFHRNFFQYVLLINLYVKITFHQDVISLSPLGSYFVHILISKRALWQCYLEWQDACHFVCFRKSLHLRNPHRIRYTIIVIHFEEEFEDVSYSVKICIFNIFYWTIYVDLVNNYFKSVHFRMKNVICIYFFRTF